MITRHIISQVRKPGRYLGSEVHVVKKNRFFLSCRVLFAFPDVYEIGMSQLGLHVLYGLINQMPRVSCERVFAPAHDCRELLKAQKLPLASLETNTAVSDFDIVGFTLQYELSYATIVDMLSLGGVSIWARERAHAEPLVIGGGPCSVNPEPLADIFDYFVIGDGEDVLPELIRRYVYYRNRKGNAYKKEYLRAICSIKGVYVPSFYECVYGTGCHGQTTRPVDSSAPLHIEKAMVADYEQSHVPTRPIIPYVEIVHDRGCVEIMRGCPHQCKFCQARAYYGPLRKRSPERIIRAFREMVEETGYEEMSLLSLSSGDYPHLETVLESLNDFCAVTRTSISLPSIRVEKMIKKLPFYLARIKKTGLTFAPEAGSERLRSYIGKNINIDYLKTAVSEAYRCGYRHVKLYFMIGLPTETYEDLDEMVRLIFDVALLRKAVAHAPADVSVSISTFIPKPHTPFEREAMEKTAVIEAKQRYLREKLHKRYIKCSVTPVDVSLLEAALSRGTRQYSAVIFRAWQMGAYLDPWKEHFNSACWFDAFRAEHIDVGALCTERIECDVSLPWGHIRL